MDDNHEQPGLGNHPRSSLRAASACLLVGLIVAAMVLRPGPRPATVIASTSRSSCCERVEASGSENTSSPSAAASFDGDRVVSADAVAEYVGGIAARVHTVDGSPVPGHLLLLMATAGSDATAQLYDQTPYTHDQGTHSDTIDSNVTAVATVETITGADLDRLEFTTAPGGGPSGGLTYAIAYLNIVSDGAFTGDLRVAATGVLEAHGYVGPIAGIDEKTAAAHFADADVLFTPSTPSIEHIDVYGARSVGELFRARNTGATLTDERRLESYRNWGTDRPNGMDIVGARHIADVAAYLCGAGSDDACHVADELGDVVIGDVVIGDAFNSDGDDDATKEAFATTRPLR